METKHQNRTTIRNFHEVRTGPGGGKRALARLLELNHNYNNNNMSKITVTPKRGQHDIKLTVSDSEGNQHVVWAVVEVDFNKNDYTLSLKKLPSHVMESETFNSDISSFFDQAAAAAAEIFEEYATQTGGRQLDLFNQEGSPSPSEA